MNPWDAPLPPDCPHCSHKGEGLNWAFPDATFLRLAQVACLNCGAHGPLADNYDEAAKAFAAGLLDEGTNK